MAGLQVVAGVAPPIHIAADLRHDVVPLVSKLSNPRCQTKAPKESKRLNWADLGPLLQVVQNPLRLTELR